jgi:N-acetylglucosamine kinase-like BadF-type ATPase
MQAFRRVTWEEDAGLEKSALSRAVLDKLGAEKADDLKGFVSSASTGDIAAFAPLVEQLANESDVSAIKILKDAGKKLGIMTKQLHQKIGAAGVSIME